MSTVQYVQVWIYDRGKQQETNKLIVAFLAFLWLCVWTTYFFEILDHPIYNLSWDTFLVMGYAKAGISFVKYVP